MATYTITAANTNIDTLTTKAGGDTYNINGTSASLTIDQDSRYGLNQNTSAILGPVNPSASLGGSFYIDGRAVRLIPYNTGSGTVPADGITVSRSGASGVLIGVYSALNVAPTAAGAAMPASGYIKIRQWNGTAFTAGLLTGTGLVASATGADVAGWIEVVGQEGSGITMNRLNNNGTPMVRGAFYKIGTTGGSRTDTYQIPSNGVDQYHAGVLVGKAAPVSISNASWSGGVLTVVTGSAHGLSTNDEVVIEGALPYAYNTETTELERITVVNSTTFTMARASNPGTYTSGGTTVAVEWYIVTPTSALVASIGTEAVRGKYCWISTAGVLRFGHDGTNSTGGFLPASGIPIYIPNVFLVNATSAAKTVNSLNASPNSRFGITTTAAGECIIDRASTTWRMNAISTPSIIEISNTAIYTSLSVTTNANQAVLDTICISSGTAHTNGVIVFTNSTEGAYVTDSVFAPPNWGAANQNIFNPTTANNFEFDNCKFISTGNKNVTSNYVVNGTTANDMLFTNCTFGVGVFLFNQSSNITLINPTYYGASGGKTEIANATSLINVISKTSGVTVDGLSFGGLVGNMQRNYLASVTTGSSDVTIKNIGSFASKIAGGAAGQTDTVTSRTTTTCTVTHVAHGYSTGDTIVVYLTDAVSTVAQGVKTITVTGVDTFTFTCINTGTTTPKISYYLSYMQGILTGAAGVVDVKVQNVNFTYTSQAPYVTVTSNKDFIFENFITEPLNPTLPTRAGANITERSAMMTSTASAAISAAYGTIFHDNYIRDTTVPNPTGASWTRSGSTITVTSAGHNLTTGDIIQISNSTVPAGAINGLVQVTAIDSGSFTYPGLASGTASGTLDYRVSDSRLAILMNEKNADTTNYYTIGSASAGLTGSGTLSQPTIGDNRTWEMPDFIQGYDSFPNILPYFFNLTTSQSQAFDLTYDINTGSGYSGSFKNLAYNRTGAGGSSASTNVTMTDTTGVAVNDYVYGTGIADGAKVQSITNSTTIVVTIANVATVSGTLTFNQLPNTGTLPADGFKLKVKLATNATNSTPITAINIPMNSTATSRARLYNQAEQYTLTFTGLVSGSDIRIVETGTATSILDVDANSGSTYDYTYYYGENPTVDIQIHKDGYEPYPIYGYTLDDADSTLPVLQELNRNEGS